MKLKRISKGVLLGMVILGAPVVTMAEDIEPTIVESGVSSPGAEKVAGDIAADFEAFAGENSMYLVEQLRSGDDLSYETSTDVENGDTEGGGETESVPETVVVENLNGPMGYGEVSMALGLAEALLGDGASLEEIVGVLYTDEGDGILDLRASGEGWGNIFASYDMTVGEVMRGIKSNGGANGMANAGPESFGDSHAGGNAGEKRPENAGPPESVELSQLTGGAEHPIKPELAGRPERPERAERPERPERPEKPDRPERP